MLLLKKNIVLCIWCNTMCLCGLRLKNTLFSTYCTLLLLLYVRLSEKQRFLQSSSFWEARRALIGQLYGALWLTEYLNHVMEMLRPSLYRDAVSRRDDTKTIKPITNETFVTSSGDIITDYNDLYCHYHVCICDRRNDKQQARLNR